MTNTKNSTPEDFDLDAFLAGAKMPEDSADIFRRSDVLGELAEIDRELKDAQEAAEAAPDEPDDALRKTIRDLESRRTELVQEFSDSRVTVYVKALDRATLAALRKANDEAWADRVKADASAKHEANQEFSIELLAAAIVGVKPSGSERQEARFTPADLRKLEAVIGTSQIDLIAQARQRAQLQAPEVTADFLRKSSGTNRGDTDA